MFQKWDELNSLRTATEGKIREQYRRNAKLNRKECEDLILDLLISAYLFGADDAEPGARVDASAMREAVYHKTDGKDFSERIAGYVESINQAFPPETADKALSPDGAEPAGAPVPSAAGGEPSGAPIPPVTGGEPSGAPVPSDPLLPVFRVSDTESHRAYTAGELDAAKKAGKKWKTWVTMRDGNVRDSHAYLEGLTVGIGEEFFTFDGDSAQAPGGFGRAENNVNCRCVLLFT